MTDPTDAPHSPQVDHADAARPGSARKAPSKAAPAADDLVWVVTRARGLHRVAASEVPAALRQAGGRAATDRDLRIAGVE